MLWVWVPGVQLGVSLKFSFRLCVCVYIYIYIYLLLAIIIIIIIIILHWKLPCYRERNGFGCVLRGWRCPASLDIEGGGRLLCIEASKGGVLLGIWVPGLGADGAT